MSELVFSDSWSIEGGRSLKINGPVDHYVRWEPNVVKAYMMVNKLPDGFSTIREWLADCWGCRPGDVRAFTFPGRVELAADAVIPFDTGLEVSTAVVRST